MTLSQRNLNKSIDKFWEGIREGSVGADRMLDHLWKMSEANSYPFYDVKKMSDDKYEISVALAGYNREFITVKHDDNILTISADVPTLSSEEEAEYLRKGIARRNFKRSFMVSEHAEISDCSFGDGLLQIVIINKIPEENLPKMIEIK